MSSNSAMLEPAEVAPPNAARKSASLWRRLAALGYDFLLLAALFMVYSLIAVGVHHGAFTPGTVARHVYQTGLAVLTVAYFTLCWVRGGQTLGALAWRIRVVGQGEARPGWPLALLRLAVAMLLALPGFVLLVWCVKNGHANLWWCAALLAGLSYWWALPDRDWQCLHDRLSRTRMIFLPR